MSTEQLNIVLIGLDELCTKLVQELKLNASLSSTPYGDEVFENPVSPMPSIVLCGDPPPEIGPSEVAQTFRMHYPDAPIYFITQNRQTFQRPILKKNGFTDAFLLPNDLTILRDVVTADVANASGGKVKSYRKVQLVDVAPGEVLGFDLYLYMPANRKHIRYVSSKDEIDEKKVSRLRQHSIKEAEVSSDQIQKFYSFTANQLKKMGQNTTMSATEKQEKLERAVRDLLSGVFGEATKDDTLAQGRQIMSDCQEIVKAYVVQGADKNSWYERFQKVTSSGDNSYLHSSNVSTFAALFSIGLGIGNPEELALAGLLHDIGLSELPLEISLKEAKDRTPEEEALYQKHPARSVDMIKEKKMIVSENVMKMILQHHERYDEKGYPNRIPRDRFKPDAQLLALADRLDEMTAIREGRPRLTHIEAIKQLVRESVDRPSEMFIDATILKKVLALFPADDTKGNAA